MRFLIFIRRLLRQYSMETYNIIFFIIITCFFLFTYTIDYDPRKTIADEIDTSPIVKKVNYVNNIIKNREFAIHQFPYYLYYDVIPLGKLQYYKWQIFNDEISRYTLYQRYDNKYNIFNVNFKGKNLAQNDTLPLITSFNIEKADVDKFIFIHPSNQEVFNFSFVKTSPTGFLQSDNSNTNKIYRIRVSKDSINENTKSTLYVNNIYKNEEYRPDEKTFVEDNFINDNYIYYDLQKIRPSDFPKINDSCVVLRDSIYEDETKYLANRNCSDTLIIGHCKILDKTASINNVYYVCKEGPNEITVLDPISLFSSLKSNRLVSNLKSNRKIIRTDISVFKNYKSLKLNSDVDSTYIKVIADGNKIYVLSVFNMDDSSKGCNIYKFNDGNVSNSNGILLKYVLKGCKRNEKIIFEKINENACYLLCSNNKIAKCLKINLTSDNDPIEPERKLAFGYYTEDLNFNNQKASVSIGDDYVYQLCNLKNSYSIIYDDKSVTHIDTIEDLKLCNTFNNYRLLSLHFSDRNGEFMGILGNGLCFFYIVKGSNGKYTYLNVNSKINWNSYPFKVEKRLDPYYFSLMVLLLFILNYFGRIIVKSLSVVEKEKKNKKILQLYPSLYNKLVSIEKSITELKYSSFKMLSLGVGCGIGGVLISYIVYRREDIEIYTGSWTDINNIMRILRPSILLLFIESFTFFFLKQYRVIFNEYKLFYSLKLKLLNYIHILELNDSADIATDNINVSKELSINMLSEKFDLYETNMKTQINEFDNTKIIEITKLLEEIKKQAK